MSRIILKASWLFLVLLILFIAACNGGGDSSSAGTTISGTAAAGAPIVGTVNIRGANGVISQSAIEADGSYTVDVAALTAPFLIWAQGTANGKVVRLYSTVDTTEENANITPATNLVLTMALGEDPAEKYTNDPDAAVPDAEEVVTAAAEVQSLLSSVFASLDMPENFDLMNGEFVVGESFDQILDTVSFQVDSTDPADVTVTIADKASGDTLFEHNASTGQTEVKLEPDQIKDIVGEGLSFQEQALALFKKMEALAETSEPTLDQLNNEILPFMTSDFLDWGMDAQEALDDAELDVGFAVTAISIYRGMSKEKGYGDYSVDEMPGYEKGNWCLVTIKNAGITQSFMTSFVMDSDGVVKWHGNQIPFDHGGDVESCHVLEKMKGRDDSMWSGLNCWAEDVGNAALSTYGIDAFIILHSSLPDLTDAGFPGMNGLLIERKSDIDPGYEITSVTPSHWNHIYTEDDGLSIDDLNAGDELVFLGVDIDTREVKKTWVDSLGPIPIKGSELTKDHFPTITAPTALSDVDIPGDVTVTWTMPTALNTIIDWVSIYFGDNTGAFSNMDEDNPDLGTAWTQTTFDTSGTAVTSPTWFTVQVNAETDSCEMVFTTSVTLW